MIVVYICLGLCANAVAGAVFYCWLDNQRGDLLALYNRLSHKPFTQFMVLSLWWIALWLLIKVAFIRAWRKK